MPFLVPVRHGAARLAALLAAVLACAVVGVPPGAAAAPPGRLAPAPGTDDEGGSASLREQLDAASKGYLDAKAALENSTRRQKELTARLKTLEAELLVRTGTIGELADVAYRTGRLSPVTALLNSGSPDGFLDRAARLGVLAANEDRALRKLLETRAQEARAKAAIEREILEQRKQITLMAKRKQQAERALAEAGGGASASGPTGSGGSGGSGGTVRPAPRNPDGSWPAESCSINDPTTDGCVTPRLLHAYQQTKAAGYTRYVSCHRDGGSGEHPKGRACDWAAQKGGFGGDATGGDRTYGNNLAAFYVRNASKLAVLYVIWYRQIWLPSSGWKSYSGAGGDPSSDHTNHVHLSVY